MGVLSGATGRACDWVEETLERIPVPALIAMSGVAVGLVLAGLLAGC